MKKTTKKIPGRLKGLSLFANIGIAEAYLRSVGVDIVVANEFVEKRAELYQRIYPDCKMICGDITQRGTYNKILAHARKQKIDVVMATPPCQGMSTAGKQKEFDERNDLFLYAIKFVKVLNPAYIFFENVPAFLTTKVMYKGVARLIPDVIQEEIGKSYHLVFNLENTQDYGVPQMRERMIMLGTRRTMPATWVMPPKDTERKTLDEAIGWIHISAPLTSPDGWWWFSRSVVSRLLRPYGL